MSAEPRLYVFGSGLEVPGLEAVFEYGDADTIDDGHIPGALRINDRTDPTRVRLSQIDGLHGKPEIADSRSPNSARIGERAGLMQYRGRTVGLTGKIEAGNIPAMRDLGRRLMATFGNTRRDLLIHVPNEVTVYRNEVLNPAFAINTSTWADPFPSSGSAVLTNTTDGDLTIGQVAVTGATGSSSVQLWADLLDDNERPQVAPWKGKDVFVAALVKVSSATNTVSQLSVGLREWNSVVPGVGASSVAATSLTKGVQNTPTTGTWYWIFNRVPASNVGTSTTYVTPQIEADLAGSGNVTVRVSKVMMSFISEDEAVPVYSDGSTPGFEWTGTPHLSASAGPYYAANLVPDPMFNDVQSGSPTLNSWAASTSTGVTVNTAPLRSVAYQGAVGASLRTKLTKDATTTSRDFTVYAKRLAPSSSSDLAVEAGHTYRWSIKLHNITVPPTGQVKAGIVWSGTSGTISANLGAAMEAGDDGVSVTATAPVGVDGATVYVVLSGTTTPSGTWDFYATDPCLVDVTYYDPGDFYGVGLSHLESQSTISPPALARRRIPTSFVLHKTRVASGPEVPEVQANLRAVRSFTMSLRAEDPRIYVQGERRVVLKMSGASKFVSTQGGESFSLETTGLPVPTGFTYEGHYITHPGSGALYRWSQRASVLRSPVYTNPNGGVELRAYDDPSPTGTAYVSPAFGNNQPAQQLRARMYRSAEGFTYTTPRVIVGGAPGSNYPTRTLDQRALNFGDYVSGSEDTLLFETSTLALLLKRISSSTWLELRWNGVSHALLASRSALVNSNPNAPYAFELWCSHNAAGSSGATRLAVWDYQSYDSTSYLYPFNRITDPMWLVSWMIGQTVHWELWTTYPSTTSTEGRIESGSYALPSPLQTLLGTAVAGSPGWGIYFQNNYAYQINFDILGSTPPYTHYYEQSDASLPPQTVAVPVIGNVDTPQKIELRGDLAYPIVSITVPAFEDQPAKTTTARFDDVALESNPITIDLAKGTVTDSFGQNRYGSLIKGSSFAALRPGNNVVSLQAQDWGTYPAHMLLSWRDALI